MSLGGNCALSLSLSLRRNKLNAGERVGHVEELEGNIRHWAYESLLLCTKHKGQPAASVLQVWKRLTGENLKINVDGAFNDQQKSGGWGFAVRDWYGEVMGSGAGRMQYVGTAVQAEATACMKALHAAVQWGMMNVQMETDCQISARALQGNEHDLAPEGTLFREIKIFARQNFNVCTFNFAPRGCNKLAHSLDAHLCQAVRQLWLEALPDDVSVLRASDSAIPV